MSIFRQIAGALEDEIRSGTPAVGERLPSEAELAGRFGASRHTVRQALGQLKARGLIESRQGRGSVVVAREIPPIHLETYSSVDELTRYSKAAPIRVHDVRDVRADAALAAELGCGIGHAFVRIEGVRQTGNPADPPICHVVVHVDGAFGRIREEARSLDRAIFEVLQDLYGIAVSRIEQDIGAGSLPGRLAGVLEARRGSPALFLQRRYFAANGRLVEAASSVFPAGRFTYRNVLRR